MRLYILRHGKAKEGSPDALRELKKKGREDIQFVLEKRLNELQTIQQIQSSALVRAEQTAILAKDVLQLDLDITENMHLTPWAKPMEFLRTIDEEKGDLLITSHQPFVSDLITVLTGQDLWMPTSSLVCLEAEYMAPQTASVIWQQNPEGK